MKSHLNACLFLLCLATGAHAQVAGSTWQLTVEDLNHIVKAKATIRFTNEVATESCMSGNWKRVIVEAKDGDDKFFPLSEPLAYQLDKGMLTLGRVSVCDGYLFLDGKFTKEKITGGFNSVSIGYSQALGKFSLNRTEKK
jgi:hypothetical protein